MNKPPKTKLRYRFMQGKLDELGMITSIDQVGRKHFVFYLNGEPKKSAMTRKTVNKQIQKLYSQHYENSNL